MPLSDIGPWLMENPSFLSQLGTLTADAVAEDLGPGFERTEAISNLSADWSYLLLCASFLATSAEGTCQAAALRIAQSCITNEQTSPARKDAAALLLNTLANHPAMELALSRELLRPGLRERLPLPFRIEWTRRNIDDTIAIGERRLRVNRFQRKFWRDADAHDWLSVSAPTSSGKSFIIGQWVTRLLGRTSHSLVIYIVPTRALISQVERDVRAMLVREGGITNGEVISAPVRSYIKKTTRERFLFSHRSVCTS